MQDIGAALFRILDHGAELDAVENAALLADALGPVESRARRIHFHRDGNDEQNRRQKDEEENREEKIEDALEEEPKLGNVAAVEGYGGKLPDVLDWAVPGQSVVHVGNDAQIDAVDAGLFEHVLHEFAFARRGEENLIYKHRARMLKESINGADNFSGGRRETGRSSGKVNESFEGVTEMADALKVMAQGVRLRPGADDEHIAGAHAAVVTVIEKEPIHEPAQAEKERHQYQVLSTMLRGMSWAWTT